ncbi:uncharacterized protein LOC130629817 isoform X2 [Hydractinia symbiolongicarpus]|uniref:uncharacterized protein LOC130629817 isoform X2 n=1 Tax=Hydractinia symbiolongicarpus TaxID=13093 RepID=UPI002551B6CF|nr:uncharacterized protein LOC130629817 isoform X2 [Hydractinia symbiolongicarpus]
MFLQAFLCVAGVLFLPKRDCTKCNVQKKYDSTMKSNFTLIDVNDLTIANHTYWLFNIERIYGIPILKKCFQYIDNGLFMGIFGLGYYQTTTYHLIIHAIEYNKTCNRTSPHNTRDDEFTADETTIVTYSITASGFVNADKFQLVFVSNESITYVKSTACNVGYSIITGFRPFLVAVGYYKYCLFYIHCRSDGAIAKIEHNLCTRRPVIYPPSSEKIYIQENIRILQKPFLFFSSFTNYVMISRNGVLSLSSVHNGYTSIPNKDTVFVMNNNSKSNFLKLTRLEYQTSPLFLSVAGNDISKITQSPFNATQLLIFTSYYDDELTNQAIFATDNNSTYEILNYRRFDDYSVIGYSERSCGSKILFGNNSSQMVHTSNVGVPGRHVFRLTQKCRVAALYPYGEENGDQLLPKGDNLVEKLQLQSPLKLNTETIHDIFISTNALISTERLSSSTDYHLYVQYPYTIIAPHNLDYDTRNSGNIYYRETKDENTLKLASMDIKSVFGFVVNITSAIIVTYLDIAGKTAPYQKDTFQVVIAHNNSKAFLILIFKQLKNSNGLVMFSEKSCCSINVSKSFNYGDTRFLSGHTNSGKLGLGKFVIDLKRNLKDFNPRTYKRKEISNTTGYDFIKISWKFEPNNSAIVTFNVVGEWETKWLYLPFDAIAIHFHNLLQNQTYRFELLDTNGNLPAVVSFSPEKIGAVTDVSIRQNGNKASLYWKTPLVKFGNRTVARTLIKHTVIESGRVVHSLISSFIYKSPYRFCGVIGSEHTFVITLAIKDQLSPPETITHTFVETAESLWKNVIIIASTCGSVLLLVFLAMVSYHRKKMKKRNKFLFTQTAYKLDPDRSILEQCNDLTYDTKFEFPRKRISLFRVLGEGAFAQVWMASAKQMEHFKPRQTKNKAGLWERYGAKKKTFVAVKTLKAGATESDYKDLANELKLLIHLGEHRNIVNLLGACTRGENLLVILEYCSNGAVLNYLRLNRYDFEASWHKQNNEIFNLYQITWIAVQIADGMNFLGEKKCVHRDLAARNVLLTEKMYAKIADFGLSRNTGGKGYYHKETEGNLPLKWMAPEAITHQKYTTKSDVWSFGILLWEIYSLGSTPYPGVKNNEMLKYVRRGTRMAKPTHCKEQIYQLMLQCWSGPPELRPSFIDLRNNIDQVLVNNEQGFYSGQSLANVYKITSSKSSESKGFRLCNF